MAASEACNLKEAHSCAFGPKTVRALQTFLNSRWEDAGTTLGPERLTVDGKFSPATIKALQAYLNRSYITFRRSLSRGSALKQRIGKDSTWMPSLGFLFADSQELQDPRKCSFAEEADEQAPPEWYMDVYHTLLQPDWQQKADAEAGIVEAKEPEGPADFVGHIVGTMVSKNVWYYLVEVQNERKDGFEIVLRTYEDFRRLDNSLASSYFHRCMLPRFEWLGSKANQESFLEERLDILQRYLDIIATEGSLGDEGNKIVTQFIRPRYLHAHLPSHPAKRDSVGTKRKLEQDDIDIDFYL